MLRLYETVDEIETVLDWLEEHEAEIRANGGVLPDELQELLEQAEGDFKTKAGRTALVVRNLEANAKAAKEEAKRLGEIAGTYENQANALKTYLFSQMQRAGEAKVETPLAKLWIQKNGRPSVRLADPKVIPAEFQRVSIAFDGQAAYEYLKSQNAIPEPEEGAIELGGLVVETGVHLRIK